MNHRLGNFQRRSAGRSNNDPFTAPNRVLDDLQFLPRIGVESIVNRNSGTIGILECCCATFISTCWLSTAYIRAARTGIRNFTNCLRLRTTKSSSSQLSSRPESKRCSSAAGLVLDPKMRTRYHEMILVWRLSTRVRSGAELRLAPTWDIASHGS